MCEAVGPLIKQKSRVKYQRLIDKTPSDPPTLLTTMHEQKRITQKTSQTITAFSIDQPIIQNSTKYHKARYFKMEP